MEQFEINSIFQKKKLSRSQNARFKVEMHDLKQKTWFKKFIAPQNLRKTTKLSSLSGKNVKILLFNAKWYLLSNIICCCEENFSTFHNSLVFSFAVGLRMKAVGSLCPVRSVVGWRMIFFLKFDISEILCIFKAHTQILSQTCRSKQRHFFAQHEPAHASNCLTNMKTKEKDDCWVILRTIQTNLSINRFFFRSCESNKIQNLWHLPSHLFA